MVCLKGHLKICSLPGGCSAESLDKSSLDEYMVL